MCHPRWQPTRRLADSCGLGSRRIRTRDCRTTVWRATIELPRLHRENIFLNIQHSRNKHDTKCMCGVYKCKKDTLLLRMVALCRKKQTPLLAASSESTAPLLSPCPAPAASFFPFPIQTLTTTDDINMPESSSVGHSYNYNH